MNLNEPYLSSKKRRLSGKSILAAIVTVLLHVMLLQTTVWYDWQPTRRPRSETSLEVTFYPLAPTQVSAAIAPAAVLAETSPTTPDRAAEITKKPRVKKPVAPAPADTVSNAVVSENEVESAPSATSTSTDASGTATAEELAGSVGSVVQAPQTGGEESGVAAPPDRQNPPDLTVIPPPSVRLNMALVRTDPTSGKNSVYGVGAIDWNFDGDKYSMSIEAGIDILITSINLYKLTSEGKVNQFGIAPELSTESRLRRAKTATHFHQEEKTISFSAVTSTISMNDGAQDKASFLMQLAGIGNADPAQFTPGREIAIQVAEEKEASIFQFQVLDEEEITTKLGKILTWHLVRQPRVGAYNSRLDIWLAPSLGWYPVQIQNTESNGTVTTQTVTKILQKNNS